LRKGDKIMKKGKKGLGFFFVLSIIFFAGSSLVYAGAVPPGGPWYANPYASGTEWTGTLFVNFVDTGKKKTSGGVGTRVDPSTGYIEYVVNVKFFLVLSPRKGKSPTQYFSGIGATCATMTDDPSTWSCQAGSPMYDEFYLVGDYGTRLGYALHNFLRTEVYPELGSSGFGDLAYAPLGEGNAQDASQQADYSAPWYWAVPVTIVTY
jgi:hypothetical protein